MITRIPAPIAQAVEAYKGVSVRSFTSASGGCINNGGKIIIGNSTYFLKWNDLNKYPGMFDAEAKGLSLLALSNSLKIPHVVFVGTAGHYQFLLLQHIEEGVRGGNYWEHFGSRLATLHKTSSATFGLDHDNYIGSLRQHNNESPTWVDFFITQRLMRQVEVAVNAGRLDTTTSKGFDRLFARLPSLLPEEAPSLLHGDLWSGNLMTTSDGDPCVIDPAVYFGHREVDLAMTQLFGGFDKRFFDVYNDTFPLLAGYEERLDVYNFYPLLVHVNLFGGGYASQVRSILYKFL